MSKVLGSITGTSKIKKGAKRAVNTLQDFSFGTSGAFGDASIDAGGLNVGGGPGAGLVPGFEGLASFFQGQAGGAPTGQLNLDPNAVVGAGLQAGQGGAGFLEGAGGFLESLQGFDADAFAKQQFDRLSSLAQPGEERAAGSLANRLFSGGRLGAGDSSTSRLFGELEQSQQRSSTERALQSFGLARDEISSRVGAAGGLAQTGLGINQGGIQNFLAAISGGTGVGGFQQDFQSSLLNNALTSTGGISQSLAPTQQSIMNLLAGAGLFQERDLATAGIQSGSGLQQANARGSLTSGILSAIPTGP